MKTTIIVPTLERPSLETCLRSLNKQDDTEIIVKRGKYDMLTKIKEGLAETNSKLVSIADDDAIYPEGWLTALKTMMVDGVGFVGGPCIPPQGDTWIERSIFKASSSIIGTTAAAYRSEYKGWAYETNPFDFSMNGLWLRKPFKEIINNEFKEIPPGASEQYGLWRLKQMGYKTVFNPDAWCWHSPRFTLRKFARQSFRGGASKMNVFKKMPETLLSRPQNLLPGLLTAWVPLLYFTGPIPLAVYIVTAATIAIKTKEPGVMIALPTEHFFYGAGLWYGLLKNKRTWK